MTLDEQLRKFLFMRRFQVPVEFSAREVRQQIRVFLRAERTPWAREILIDDLLLMLIDHLAEKEG